MNDLEAINIRKSVRNFSDKKIEDNILEELNETIAMINKESDLNIEVHENGANYFNSVKITYGMFAGVKSIIVLKGKKKDDNLKEKIGYYGERLILDLTKHGIGTCWVGGTYDRDKMKDAISDDEELIALIPFGYPKEKEKLVTVLAMKKMHANSKTRAEMIASISEDAPQWFLDGVDAVVKAPSAINEQLVKFKYDGKDAYIYSESSRHSGMIDLGIAKLHFEIAAKGKFDWQNNAKFIKD